MGMTPYGAWLIKMKLQRQESRKRLDNKRAFNDPSWIKIQKSTPNNLIVLIFQTDTFFFFVKFFWHSNRFVCMRTHRNPLNFYLKISHLSKMFKFGRETKIFPDKYSLDHLSWKRKFSQKLLQNNNSPEQISFQKY